MLKLTIGLIAYLVCTSQVSCSPAHHRRRHAPQAHRQAVKWPPRLGQAQDLSPEPRKHEPRDEAPASGTERDFSLDDESPDSPEKPEARRGINIGLRVKLPSTKKPPRTTPSPEKEAVQQVLQNLLNDTIEQAIENGGSPDVGQALGILTNKAKKHTLKPAFKCDEWEPKYRVCILERNLGDTVTFYLSTGKPRTENSVKVTWRKEYHMKNSAERKSTVIDPENSSENIIVGNRGYELRVSPITEIDLGFNLFSATLEGETSSRAKLMFMVRIVPIDLGFVYVGETLEINLRSFVSLPSDSLTYKWYMEKDGEHGTLPSNMKVTATGSSIKISELRQDQEGVLGCSVYTNKNFLATKKRFLIKDLEANFGVLKMTPDHNIDFQESPLERSLKDRLRRSRRSDNVDALISKVLRQSSDADESDNGPDADYNLAQDLGVESQERTTTSPPTLTGDRRRPVPSTGGRENQDQLQFDMQVDENLSSASGRPQASGQNNQEAGSPGREASQQTGDSAALASRPGEFVLNIDRFPNRNKVAAEETIAKLVSYCLNDSDCSERAICVRDTVQDAGFCRCLPGFTGVGIFCRENVWMSNENYGVNRGSQNNPEGQDMTEAPYQ